MNWFIATLGSSIGKKLMMAATGLAFIGFLAAHLAGNLMIYRGKAAFNSYAEGLQALGPVLFIWRAGLISLALVHILTGVYLFFQNRWARPVRYDVTASAGGKTLSSRIMPYTGLSILVFVIFHLLHFTFVDKTTTTIFDIVAADFQNWLYVIVYVAFMMVVALHVRHGFWSAFQTLGANHPKYMPAVSVLSVVAGLVVALGFGLLPIAVLLKY